MTYPQDLVLMCARVDIAHLKRNRYELQRRIDPRMIQFRREAQPGAIAEVWVEPPFSQLAAKKMGSDAFTSQFIQNTIAVHERNITVKMVYIEPIKTVSAPCLA